MKRIVIVTALAVGVSALSSIAQDAGGPPKRHADGPGGEGQHPKPPIISALDANHDGTIDATEIAKASAALKSLDKNGDGQLTSDEVRPQHAGGAGREGFGGPKGHGPRGDHQGPPPEK